MDVSFLLATIRPPAEFANIAIKAALDAETYGMSREVVVCSPDLITGNDIVWVRDPTPGIGSIHAYNLAYNNSCGDYIVGIIDDCLVHREVLQLVNVLKSDLFKDRRFKVICMMNVCGRVYYPPSLGMTPWPGCPFPVIARETIEKELNGYLCNPQFIHGATDNFAGFWLAFNGEPCVWSDNYHITELKAGTHFRDKETMRKDTETYERLIMECVNGQRKVYAP